MDQEKHHNEQPSADGVDVTLPLAIVIAAILVGGSVLYGARSVSDQISKLPGATTVAVGDTGGTKPPTAQPQPQPTSPPAPAPQVDVAVGKYPAMGKASAKVTLVEFTDLECSFCKRFNDETFPQIKKEYIDTGKVKYYARHYPLPFHTNASKAGEAIACANDQGKFWEMKEAIFKDQGNIGVDALKEKAKVLAMNATTFASCLDGGKMKAQVDADMKDGTTAGVSGTPTFFVNGKRIVGAVPFDQFKTLIEAELAKA